MIIEGVKVTVLKVEEKKGVGKTSGKPYAFFSASLIDADSNVFDFNLSDDLAKNAKVMESLLSVRNTEAVVSVNLYPKGFGIGAQLTAIKLQK